MCSIDCIDTEELELEETQEGITIKPYEEPLSAGPLREPPRGEYIIDFLGDGWVWLYRWCPVCGAYKGRHLIWPVDESLLSRNVCDTCKWRLNRQQKVYKESNVSPRTIPSGSGYSYDKKRQKYRVMIDRKRYGDWNTEETAKEVVRLVRQMLLNGDTPEDIREHIRNTYGGRKRRH